MRRTTTPLKRQQTNNLMHDIVGIIIFLILLVVIMWVFTLAPPPQARPDPSVHYSQCTPENIQAIHVLNTLAAEEANARYREERGRAGDNQNDGDPAWNTLAGEFDTAVQLITRVMAPCAGTIPTA